MKVLLLLPLLFSVSVGAQQVSKEQMLLKATKTATKCAVVANIAKMEHNYKLFLDVASVLADKAGLSEENVVTLGKYSIGYIHGVMDSLEIDALKLYMLHCSKSEESAKKVLGLVEEDNRVINL